jgi:hypothetical protein
MRIKLTEAQLHRVIKESVRKILREGNYGIRYNGDMMHSMAGSKLYGIKQLLESGNAQYALKEINELKIELRQSSQNKTYDYNESGNENFEQAEPQFQIMFNYLDQAKEAIIGNKLNLALNYINALLENNSNQ